MTEQHKGHSGAASAALALSAPPLAGLETPDLQAAGLELFRAPSRDLLLAQLRQAVAAGCVGADEQTDAPAHRLALVATTGEQRQALLAQAIAMLRERDTERFNLGQRLFYRWHDPAAAGATAVLFPGFGTRDCGLLPTLYRRSSAVRRWFDQIRPDFCAPERRPRERYADAPLGRMLDAILLADLGLWVLLRDLGLHCDLVLGHSFGEQAALVAAQAVPAFPALAQLLGRLACTLEAHERQHAIRGMLAVSAAARDLLAPYLAGDPPAVHVALDNCPQQLVLWGSELVLERIEAELAARGLISFRLADLCYPVHTPAFQVAAEALQLDYAQLPLEPPRIPIWSCASVAPLPSAPAALRAALVAQWQQPVRLRETLERLYAQGVRTFVEVGPGERLTGFVRDTLRGRGVTAITTNRGATDPLPTLLSALAQLFVAGQELDRRRIATLVTDARKASGATAMAVTGPTPAAIQAIIPASIPASIQANKPSNIPATIQVERNDRGAVVPGVGELTDCVRRTLASLLEVEDAATLDPDSGFFELGLGSLGCVELGESLARTLNLNLPQTFTLEYPSIASLGAALAAKLATRPKARSNAQLTLESCPWQAAAVGLDPTSVGAPMPVAIIGIGCRLPGGIHCADGLWELLTAGIDAIGTVPPQRWDVDACARWVPPESRASTRHGAFIEGIEDFDAAFFGISPREAETLDPQQRLLLETSWESLEDAALDPRGLAGSATGVFVGISNNDYASRLTTAQRLAVGGYFGTGNSAATAAGRIAYLLGLNGPCLALDTACSSSLVAVHLACRALRAGDCNLALAGGVNLMLNPETTLFLAQGRALAADGRCKTFSAAADGYVRAEGGAMVVLKPLASALTDGDPVLAVIRGSAINHDGASAGLTVPSGAAQQAVLRAALADAGVAPHQVGYLETHGTGTALGDPIEVQSIGAVFGADSARRAPLYLGSVKTNLGHLEAAAGMAGLIKCVLQLARQRLVASLHCRELNPRIDWDALPVAVVRAGQAWSVPGSGPRIAGLSGFGISGTNAHLVLEEAPAAAPVETRSPGPTAELLVLCAQDPRALVELAGRVAECVRDDDDETLAAHCRTSRLGRARLRYRAAWVVDSGAQAAARLLELEHQAVAQEAVRCARTAPRVAFLFTGQGAQYAGMGRALYASMPTFRSAFQQCSDLAAPWLQGSLTEVVFGDDDGRLGQTVWTQPALFALGYALATLWRSWGIEPVALIGHSIGEYVAACLAGVFDLAAAMRLVCLRGRLLQSLPEGGGMLAVATNLARVATLLGQRPNLALAADNGPRALVLSGPQAEIDAARRWCDAAGIDARVLTVSHAFHSPLTAPILERFRDAFGSAEAPVVMTPPRLPVYSTLSGRRAGAELASADYWVEQVRRPVQFATAMSALLADGCDACIEMGPRPVLLGLGQALAAAPAELRWLPSLQPPQPERELLLQSLASLLVAGAPVDWRGFERSLRESGSGGGRAGRRARLPTYPFQRRRYWIEAQDQGLPLPAARVQPPRQPDPPESPSAAAALPAELPRARLARLLAAGPDAVAQARRQIVATIDAIVCAVLKLPADEAPTPEQPLGELGLDSLMAQGISIGIQQALGAEVPALHLLSDNGTASGTGTAGLVALVLADLQRPAVSATHLHADHVEGEL